MHYFVFYNAHKELRVEHVVDHELPLTARDVAEMLEAIKERDIGRGEARPHHKYEVFKIESYTPEQFEVLTEKFGKILTAVGRNRVRDFYKFGAEPNV